MTQPISPLTLPSVRSRRPESDLALARDEECTSDGPAGNDSCPFPPEALLRAVLRSAPLVLWATDERGLFTYSDGSGLAKLGLRPGQVVGASLEDMYRDVDGVVDDFHRALGGETFRQVSNVNGLYFDNWEGPLVDDDGAVRGVLGVSTDVTEQYVAQEEERQSRRRFQMLFELTPAAMAFTDLETGVIVDVNPAFERISKGTRAALVGSSWVGLGFFRSEAERAELLNELRTAGRIVNRKRRGWTVQGEPLSIRWSAEIVRWDGRLCTLAVVNDVTQQCRRAAALRRKRAEFRALARLAPVAICRVRSSGRVRYANGLFRKWTGLNSLDDWDTSFWGRVVAEYRDGLRASWDESLADGLSGSWEFEFETASDGRHWMLLKTQFEFSKSGLRHNVIGVLVNITQQKKAERILREQSELLEQQVQMRTRALEKTNAALDVQIRQSRTAQAALARSESQWKALITNTPEFILLLDRQRRVQFANRYRPDLGYEGTIGHPVEQFVEPQYREEARRIVTAALTTGECGTQLTQSKSLTGETFWYSNSVGPVRLDGEIVGATAVVRDVTREIRDEEESRQRQAQLAHLSRLSTAGEMAAILAHEVNQPLVAIANFANGCIRRLAQPEGDLQTVIKALEAVSSQAQRAGEIIHRMREFVKKCDGKHVRVSLKEMTTQAWELASLEARKQRILFQFVHEPNTPPVFADEIQIVQVIVNLMMNAIDASTQSLVPNPTVTVRVFAHPTVGDAHEGRSIVFSIRDQGPGIPEKLAQTIFDPFVTTKPTGLGMGLSISKTIIEAHHGKLWAENRSAEGAEFAFSLPLPAGEPKR